MPADHVIDVTAANFETEVLRRSMQVPVLLDFWADWCGPCRVLGPVLEKLAEEYGGAFVLGKVDTERELDLAAAFQVQSIPFVLLLAGGRPIDGFTGALPEPEVRRFLAAMGVEPAAGASPAEPAADDVDSPAARLASAREAVRRGDLGAARAAVAGIPPEDELAAVAERLVGGLDWLEADLGAEPAAAAALARARDRFRAGELTAAMEALLESAAVDRSFRDGMARRAMLTCFVVAGEDGDLADGFRRRLSTVLY